MLKYINHDITFSEVPDEVSLVLSISGCPNKCEDCHSTYLRDDIGIVLDTKEIDKLIGEYGSLITTICFLGGDWKCDRLVEVIDYIKTSTNLKVAVYSGYDEVNPILKRVTDYLKIGSYKKHLGGLESKTTNQRMFKIVNGCMEDITYKFFKHERPITI